MTLLNTIIVYYNMIVTKWSIFVNEYTYKFNKELTYFLCKNKKHEKIRVFKILLNIKPTISSYKGKSFLLKV